MRLLLDTHAWLRFVLAEPSLSKSARALIEEPTNEKLVSPASYWETAIKISLGKYRLPQPYEEFVTRAIADQGFTILPMLPRHTTIVANLPFHHRDPFDRLLVAQAKSENIAIVSGDDMLDAYGITRFW